VRWIIAFAVIDRVRRNIKPGYLAEMGLADAADFEAESKVA
jgi:hypothetical protein